MLCASYVTYEISIYFGILRNTVMANSHETCISGSSLITDKQNKQNKTDPNSCVRFTVYIFSFQIDNAVLLTSQGIELDLR